MDTIRLTTAQALIKFLDNQYICFDSQEEKFVEGMFALFGHGCVVGLGDALSENNHSLKVFQGHNEQGMTHAAIAFAKQHNRRKMMAVTSSIGPGSLNLSAAAGTATVNRIPVLLLPGDAFATRQPDPALQQVENEHNHHCTGSDALKPLVKYWDRIVRPEQLMVACINAFRVLSDPAQTGAVSIALPQDVQGEAYDYPIDFFEKRVWQINRRPLSENESEYFVNLLKSKNMPMLICGGGVKYSEAGDIFSEFALKYKIPFAETMAGKGTVRWDHPMNLGILGVVGTQCANDIAAEADLVIAVGTRLNDFVTSSKWGFRNPKVEIATINVNRYDCFKMGAYAFTADAGKALEQLDTAISESGFAGDFNRNEIKEAIDLWNAERDKLKSWKDEQGLTQTRVISLLNDELLPRDCIILNVSGSTPGDLGRLWRPLERGSFHLEYGFSCMGYEIPGAIGVKLAEPTKEVYSICGDGAYIMMNSELVTSIQEGIKINILLFDNHGFQSIDNLQVSQGIPHFGCEFRFRDERSNRLDGNYIPIDFAKNAESYGCRTWTVHSEEELRSAIEESKMSPVSTLIDIKILPNSMSGNYGGWWRVGTPEVSFKDAVLESCKDQVRHIKDAKQY